MFPTYPGYHTGHYLEEMFAHHKESCGDRYLIPIFWTNAYKQNQQQIIQEKLDQLDPTKKYYCVSTHDDAPTEKLPPDTLVFAGGGNNPNTIPIPLVVSKVPEYKKEDKTIRASFVGSHTHAMRGDMAAYVPPEYVISMQPSWSDVITDERFSAFEETSIRSEYMLCPRGYGPTSYRMYEAFQYGAIPVYISDRFWLPWEKELNWDNLIIKITPQELPNIKQILDDNEEMKDSMLEYAASVYDEYFSLDGVFKKIIEKVEGK